MCSKGVEKVPFISKVRLHELETKAEVYENLITELPTETQNECMENLATWGVFSKKIHGNVKLCELAEEKFREDRREVSRCQKDSCIIRATSRSGLKGAAWKRWRWLRQMSDTSGRFTPRGMC